MTALSADTVRASRNLGDTNQYKVVASDIIYAGALVMLDSAGHANPAAASVTNRGCVGVAMDQADNSSGSAGDILVTVQEGEFRFTADTLTQAAVGTVIFADDDDTVDTTSSNAPRAGFCSEFESATVVWLKVGLGFNA